MMVKQTRLQKKRCKQSRWQGRQYVAIRWAKEEKHSKRRKTLLAMGDQCLPCAQASQSTVRYREVYKSIGSRLSVFTGETEKCAPECGCKQSPRLLGMALQLWALCCDGQGFFLEGACSHICHILIASCHRFTQTCNIVHGENESLGFACMGELLHFGFSPYLLGASWSAMCFPHRRNSSK